jgi:hypothetical protein
MDSRTPACELEVPVVGKPVLAKGPSPPAPFGTSGDAPWANAKLIRGPGDSFVAYDPNQLTFEHTVDAKKQSITIEMKFGQRRLVLCTPVGTTPFGVNYYNPNKDKKPLPVTKRNYTLRVSPDAAARMSMLQSPTVTLTPAQQEGLAQARACAEKEVAAFFAILKDIDTRAKAYFSTTALPEMRNLAQFVTIPGRFAGEPSTQVDTRELLVGKWKSVVRTTSKTNPETGQTVHYPPYIEMRIWTEPDATAKRVTDKLKRGGDKSLDDVYVPFQDVFFERSQFAQRRPGGTIVPCGPGDVLPRSILRAQFTVAYACTVKLGDIADSFVGPRVNLQNAVVLQAGAVAGQPRVPSLPEDDTERLLCMAEEQYMATAAAAAAALTVPICGTKRDRADADGQTAAESAAKRCAVLPPDENNDIGPGYEEGGDDYFN